MGFESNVMHPNAAIKSRVPAFQQIIAAEGVQMVNGVFTVIFRARRRADVSSS
jgi:hypothetical protein